MTLGACAVNQMHVAVRMPRPREVNGATRLIPVLPSTLSSRTAAQPFPEKPFRRPPAQSTRQASAASGASLRAHQSLRFATAPKGCTNNKEYPSTSLLPAAGAQMLRTVWP